MHDGESTPRANETARRAMPEVIEGTTTPRPPEPIRAKRRRPMVRIGLAVAAVGTLTGGLVFGSDSEPAPGVVNADYSRSADNYAGAQIALHEGTHGKPNIRYSVTEQTLGHDVSGHQGDVDWNAARGGGARFVYIKASEGTGYLNPNFAQQYKGSAKAGIVRGSYHFARPDVSTGADQANYFIEHGGGWTPDGKTLPGALDAEYNPYGDACYGKDAAGMTAWIKDFSNTYKARTGRRPVIYTSTTWWKRCTGNTPALAANPLWLARYNTTIGDLPAGWKSQTIWQFAAQGPLPGDQNWLNGSLERLNVLAKG